MKNKFKSLPGKLLRSAGVVAFFHLLTPALYNIIESKKTGDNNIFISTTGVDTGLNRLGAVMRYPKISILPGNYDTPAEVFAAIKTQVTKRGTLDEVIINVHGLQNYLAFKSSGVSATGFLSSLAKAQRDFGTQFSKRYVLASCDVMEDLSPFKVAAIGMFSQMLNAEIVGSTALAHGGPNHSGRYVKFTPDGDVSRDILDAPYDPTVIAGNWLEGVDSRHTPWFDQLQLKKTRYENAQAANRADLIATEGHDRTAEIAANLLTADLGRLELGLPQETPEVSNDELTSQPIPNARATFKPYAVNLATPTISVSRSDTGKPSRTQTFSAVLDR